MESLPCSPFFCSISTRNIRVNASEYLILIKKKIVIDHCR